MITKELQEKFDTWFNEANLRMTTQESHFWLSVKRLLHLAFQEGANTGYVDGFTSAREIANSTKLKVAPEVDKAIELGVNIVVQSLDVTLGKLKDKS